MPDPNDIIKQFMDTRDTTDEFDQDDIQQNSLVSIFSYLSWLVLVPIISSQNSGFTRFHANQGLILAIIETAGNTLLGALSYIPYIGFMFGIILALVNLACVVLSIIGIVNASRGEAKELPIIGGIRLLK